MLFSFLSLFDGEQEEQISTEKKQPSATPLQNSIGNEAVQNMMQDTGGQAEDNEDDSLTSMGGMLQSSFGGAGGAPPSDGSSGYGPGVATKNKNENDNEGILGEAIDELLGQCRQKEDGKDEQGKSKSAPNKTEPGLSKEEIDTYKNHSAKGLELARLTAYNADLRLLCESLRVKAIKKMPPAPTAIDPHIESQLLNQYFNEVSRYQPIPNAPAPKGPSIGPGDPNFDYSDRRSFDERLLARKKAILAQLSWMTKNSMGAGAYGLNRAGGRSHDESMSRAKAVQAIFNLGSGLRDSKAARQTKDSIKSPTKTLPGKVEPRISPDQ